MSAQGTIRCKSTRRRYKQICVTNLQLYANVLTLPQDKHFMLVIIDPWNKSVIKLEGHFVTCAVVCDEEEEDLDRETTGLCSGAFIASPDSPNDSPDSSFNLSSKFGWFERISLFFCTPRAETMMKLKKNHTKRKC